MNTNFEKLADAFRIKFDREAEFVARAPGRVNLIGEHTDYNGGLVLPMAIDRKIEIWFAPRDDSTVNLHSQNFDEQLSFSLAGTIEKQDEASWVNYVKGVAQVLQSDGSKLKGFDGLIFGDVPVASGLSSSAAIEVAAVLAFKSLCGEATPAPLEVAKLAQRAECEFVGVNCGLMDQFISAAAVEDCALKIACDTMEYSPITLPENAAIVIADTKLPRTLAGSAYNQRRAECDEALELIKAKLSDRFDIKTMADINVEVVDASQAFLPPTLFRRVRHVATENLRVEDAAKALAAGDLASLGQLFDASHASLRDDYEVSSEGLDLVTSLMRETPGCFGARLTGAGFGGCAIALVDASTVDTFVNELNESCDLTPKPEFFWSKSVAGGLVRTV